jgi:6-phosphogluconolactonase
MISVFRDREQLSRAAAGFIVQRALSAIRESGRFTVALSGGHTPERTYELLAMKPFRDQMPWADVHFFWGDERCVSPDDEQSNQRMARDALLNHVPISTRQIHPINCMSSPPAGAKSYERCLRRLLGQKGRFEMILLGLGTNGHTASLFPRSSVLNETARWVAPLFVPEQGLHRVTLTAPLINRARTVLFLVSGRRKAPSLEAVLYGARDPIRWPAQLISPADGDLHWFVDETAAARVLQRDRTAFPPIERVPGCRPA